MPRIVLVGTRSPTNTGLIEAFRRLGWEAQLASPDDALKITRADDVLVGRLGPPESPDAAGPGLEALAALERAGVRILNASASLRLCHDKLATADRLFDAGIPHPRTALLDEWTAEMVDPPLVLKPRFGDGGDVYLCVDAAELEETVALLAGQPWLRRRGAIVQELVPTGGQDVRVIVAGGRAVGGIRRMAPPGGWHTGGAGGGRCRTRLTKETSALAVAAAAAVGGDLVGVDLVALWNAQTVIDVNGCADFTGEYAPGSDGFTEAAAALLDEVVRRSANTS